MAKSRPSLQAMPAWQYSLCVKVRTICTLKSYQLPQLRSVQASRWPLAIFGRAAL